MDGIDLAILGCGHMGAAILRGAIRAGVLAPDRVLVVDPSAEARERAVSLGARASADAIDARAAPRLLLAVKPQSFDGLAHALAPLAGEPEVVSVMSGWTRARIGASLRLKHGAARVVRAMPNLPVTVGRGATAIAGDAAPFVVRLFESVGRVIAVDESLLDAVTAVSGSGPAYAFLLAESMIDAAMRLGFDAPTARRLVFATIDGAAAMLLAEDRDPAELRDAVTSRGGTTEAATGVWMERGVPDAIVAAIEAAAARAGELGRAQ